MSPVKAIIESRSSMSTGRIKELTDFWDQKICLPMIFVVPHRIPFSSPKLPVIVYSRWTSMEPTSVPLPQAETGTAWSTLRDQSISVQTTGFMWRTPVTTGSRSLIETGPSSINLVPVATGTDSSTSPMVLWSLKTMKPLWLIAITIEFRSLIPTVHFSASLGAAEVWRDK